MNLSESDFEPPSALVVLLLQESEEHLFPNDSSHDIPGLRYEEIKAAVSEFLKDQIRGLFHTMARSLRDTEDRTFALGTKNAFEHSVQGAILYRFRVSPERQQEFLSQLYTCLANAATSATLYGPGWKVETRDDALTLVSMHVPKEKVIQRTPRTRATVVHFGDVVTDGDNSLD